MVCTSEAKLKVIAVIIWLEIIGRLFLDGFMIGVLFNGIGSTTYIILGYEATLAFGLTAFKILGFVSIAVHIVWAIPSTFLSKNNQVHQSSPGRLASWILVTLVVCVFDIAATVVSILKAKDALEWIDRSYVFFDTDHQTDTIFGALIPPLIFSRGIMFIFNVYSMIMVYQRVKEIKMALANPNTQHTMASAYPNINVATQMNVQYSGAPTVLYTDPQHYGYPPPYSYQQQPYQQQPYQQQPYQQQLPYVVPVDQKGHPNSYPNGYNESNTSQEHLIPRATLQQKNAY